MAYFVVNLNRKNGPIAYVLPADDAYAARRVVEKQFGCDVKIVDVQPYRGVVIRDVRAEQKQG